MRQVKALYVLVGFSGDVDRPIANLKKHFSHKNYDFAGRTYPDRADKRTNYLKDVGSLIVDYIFGPTGSTEFCRSYDHPCATENRNERVCRNQNAKLACYRARPRLLLFICHRRISEEVLWRYGRAVLILQFDSDDLSNPETIKKVIEQNESCINTIESFITNRKRNMLAPLMPMQNFQVKGGHLIARRAQAEFNSFGDLMEHFHKKLYDHTFQNARKKYMRGAYKLCERIGFQRHKLHSEAIIGASSRDDVFHLINAFHLFGVATMPGLHFDIVAAGGDELRTEFIDVVTGAKSKKSEKHINVSPCDRIL